MNSSLSSAALPRAEARGNLAGMIETEQSQRERRLKLAQQAYRQFFAQCFWSSDPGLEITEELIPFVIEGLRHYGGHKGYRVAAELCH